MKAIISTLFVTTMLMACANTHDVADYRDVTIEELVAQPGKYKDEWIRVSGFLVTVNGDLQLLDSKWTDCYSDDPERRYLTTTLPRSVMGEVNPHPAPFGPKFTNHGRFVTVVGQFEASVRPWGPLNVGDVPLIAAGPLKSARVVEMQERFCAFRR